MPHHLVCVEKFTLPYLTLPFALCRCRPVLPRLACNRTMPPAASVAELRAVRARLAELTERSMIGRNNQRGHATEVRLRLVGQHKTGTSSNQPGRRNSETAQASKSNRMRAQARRIEEMASQGAGASARFRPRAVDLSAAGSRRSAQGECCRPACAVDEPAASPSVTDAISRCERARAQRRVSRWRERQQSWEEERLRTLGETTGPRPRRKVQALPNSPERGDEAPASPPPPKPASREASSTMSSLNSKRSSGHERTAMRDTTSESGPRPHFAESEPLLLLAMDGTPTSSRAYLRGAPPPSLSTGCRRTGVRRRSCSPPLAQEQDEAPLPQEAEYVCVRRGISSSDARCRWVMSARGYLRH